MARPDWACATVNTPPGCCAAATAAATAPNAAEKNAERCMPDLLMSMSEDHIIRQWSAACGAVFRGCGKTPWQAKPPAPPGAQVAAGRSSSAASDACPAMLSPPLHSQIERLLRVLDAALHMVALLILQGGGDRLGR